MTFAAALTSSSVKNEPYFIGHDRMAGQSTFVPSTFVFQFWLP